MHTQVEGHELTHLTICVLHLSEVVNRELPDVQAGFRKGRGTRDQITNICWIIEKACSWASLMAQLVKNPPAVQETWVQSLGWEDPLGRGKATHSSILAWRIP